jgi:hypothetical protein
MLRIALGLVLLGAAPLQDEKKGPPPDPKPKIAMALPLGVTPGATTKVTLRGQNLDQATEVKFSLPIEGGSVAIKGKGKAEIPKETDPAVYGDTKVDLEVKLPAGVSAVSLVAVNAAGETKPHELVVLPKEQLVQEKEPNGGFATAQPVEPGQVVQGVVSQALDVDVFKFTAKKGENWFIEVEAHRRGSILDAMLTIYDSAGHTLAVADDSASSRDPSIKLVLPADGTYFVALMDAHNTGGSTHVYLLRLRRDH